MNTETVVFFYVREKTAGRRYPWQKADFVINDTVWCGRRLVAAGIPEYDYNRKPWKREVLKRKVSAELIPLLKLECPETTSYLYNKNLHKTKTGRLLEGIFPLELFEIPGKKGMAKVTPEDITEGLIKEYCSYDALIVIDKSGKAELPQSLNLPEFVANHCANVNFLAIITDNPEPFVEIIEELNEEYGLAGMFASDLAQIKVPARYKVLVVDGGVDEKSVWRNLPPCCTYLDLLSMTERQRLIEARRKDVRYISFYRQIYKKIRTKIPVYG